MKRTAKGLLLLGAPIAIACIVASGGNAPSAIQPTANKVAAAPAAGSAGMRAYIDPETGQLGTGQLPPLTAEEKAQLEPTGVPVETVLPDGSVMIELNGTCQEFTVMKIDPSGKRSVQCVQDPQSALQSPAAAAKPEER